MSDITRLQEDADKRQQEVLSMIEGLSNTSSSDGTSSVGHWHYFYQILRFFCTDKQGLFWLAQQVYMFIPAS
jgi:hypothetical protein